MAAAIVVPEPSQLSLRSESSRSSLSASAESSLSASTSTSLDTSTRTGILRTPSSCSIVTSPSTNISFAPLPTVEPRRRKSNVALGVAARSRMLALRRQLREQGIDPNLAAQLPLHFPSDGSPPIPIWEHNPDAKLEDEDDTDLGTDPAEEAFAAIGKFVKGATRSLFRRKSTKDVSTDTAHAPPSPTSAGTAGKVPRSRSDEHLSNHSPSETKENKEGSVWEEEVGTDTWSQLRSGTQAEGALAGGAVDENACRRTSIVEVVRKKKSPSVFAKKPAAKTKAEAVTEMAMERSPLETPTMETTAENMNAVADSITITTTAG